MKSIATWIAAFWIAFTGMAHAQSSPVVVELFTSQGCSSCPPADALMHKLATREDVIALSMHVDYWDYIGWKDEFGRAENTARQKAYAAQAGRRSIYTPQMIINGEDSVVGTHPMDVSDLVAKHRAAQHSVALKLARSGASVQIAASATRAGAYEVTLVRFAPKKTTAIKRGENAGKTLNYVNVVSDFKVIGTWDGKGPLSMTASAGEGPLAVLIQHKNHGAIEAAARIN